MVENTKENWSTTSVRSTLVEEIKKILQTKAAKREGLTNVSQFVDTAVRDLIDRIESERMTHLNMYDDHVKILDNHLGNIGRIVSVYFKRGRRSWCDYCEEPGCVHVQYAWEIPKVGKILRGMGMKPPPSRA